jgi:hypothetical protein
MCRNITTLRGLEPPATDAEIRAAAEQYIRKVSGVPRPTAATGAAYAEAVDRVAAATAQLLADLPPRRVPPRSEPPLRRLATAAGAGQRAPNTSATSDNA